MTRRVLAAVAALGLLTALGGLTGCAVPDRAEGADGCEREVGKLVMWVDDSRLAALGPAVAAFKAEQCVTVELVRKNFGDLRADFGSQVAAGKGPDITIGANDWLGEFRANGLIAPVDLSPAADDLAPVAVRAFTQEGQTYGVPYALESIALVRNNELLAETQATTFDELIEEAKGAGTDYTILLQVGDVGDAYHMFPIQSSFGAPVLKTDAAGDYIGELGMAGEPGYRFAAYIAGLGQAGVLSTSINDSVAKDQFKAGNAPYVITGPWNTTGDDSFQDAGMDITVLPIPPAGDQEATPFLGVQGFYVSANTEHTFLAQMFLVDYLTRPEVQLDLFKAGGRTPANLEAQADPDITDDPIASGFTAAAATAVVQPSIPEMNQVWTPLGQEEAELISGKAKDPSGTWDEMIANIEGAIAQSAD